MAKAWGRNLAGMQSTGLPVRQGDAHEDRSALHVLVKSTDLTCICPCAEKNLEALRGILERLPSNACLCFVGDGPSRPDLAKHFEGLPVYFTVSRMTFSWNYICPTEAADERAGATCH